MDKEALQKLIELLESSNSKDDAHFGIHLYVGGPDESYIKANKQGLELYAAEMLKASRDAEDIVNHKEKNIITLAYDEEWLDGDTCIQYVEPYIGKRPIVKETPYQENWTDNLMKYGCVGILILLALSTIIGLITIVNWIF